MTLPGFTHRMVRVGEVNLHAVIGGEGPPLVLLHGFPQTWWEWRKMMPLLAARHTVIAPDLRGAGHSECPQGGYDKTSLAADIHGLMQALGHARYAVCGHDIGGMVAVALAATQRRAVTHLAVLDVPLPGWSRWEAIFSDARVWHFAFHMKPNLPERLLHGREYDYVSTFIFDRTFNQGAHDIADVEVFARAFAQPGRTRGGLEWYRAFPKDHADALAWKREPLAMPVLALGGDQRWGPEIVTMLQEFAADVRGGSVSDCNHWLPEERPEETADALLSFLSGRDIAEGVTAMNGVPPFDGLNAHDKACDELARGLQEHVKTMLAPFKYPRWIEFRQELPKTATGKIQRFKLRAETPPH